MQLAQRQLLGQWRHPATTCSTHRRRSLRTLAAAKRGGDPASDVKNARLARILRQYDDTGTGSQQADLETYLVQRNTRMGDEEAGASRTLRPSAGTRAALDEWDQAKLDLYLPLAAGKSIREPNYGLHSKGEAQWWALVVKAGREKQVAEALTCAVEQMETLEALEEGGPPRERTIETMTPKKTLKVWNPKTGKMSTKVLRYPARYTAVLDGATNGGWVLVRTVMDDKVYACIKNNPSFIHWCHMEKYTDYEGLYNRDERTHVFPKPCPPEVLADIKDWEMDLAPVSEEAVREVLALREQEANKQAGYDTFGIGELEETAPDAWPYGDRGDGGEGDRPEDQRGRSRFQGHNRYEERGGSGGGGGGGMRERQGAGFYSGGSEGRRTGGGFERQEQRYGDGGGRFEGRGNRRRSGDFGGGGGGQWEERVPGRQFEGQRERGRGGWEAAPARQERGGGGWETPARQERGPGRGLGGRGGGYGERRERSDRGSWEGPGQQDRAWGGSFEDRREWGGTYGEGRERSDRGSGGGGVYGERRGRGVGRNDSGGRRSQGQSWYEGGGGGAGAGASGAASPWGSLDDDMPVAALGGSTGFSGWVDSAAADFDFFDSPTPAPAAVVPADASTGAAGSSWSWGEALGQQPPPATGAAQEVQAEQAAGGSGFAVDAGGMWDEQPAADPSWRAAPGADSGGVAYGIPPPSQTPQQQQQHPVGEWRAWRTDGRGGGEGRGGRLGERNSERGGRFGDRFSNRLGDRRGGRFGNRGGQERGERGGGGRGERFGDDRRGGGRFGDRDRRGGWYEGGRSGSQAGGGAAGATTVDLAWWDGDSGSDETGFTGMYQGAAEWERREESRSGATAEPRWAERDAGSELRNRSRSGSGGHRNDDRGWEGDIAGAGGGRGGKASPATFQPGQAVAVTGGNFRDFEGTVVATEGGRVTAELDIFGKRTRVQLNPSEISATSENGDSGGSATDA